MISQTILSTRVGRRIDGYRNSAPRYIKVLGVGEGAQTAIARLNDAHRDNVLASGRIEPAPMRPMDEPVDGKKPNAVVVVYQRGDEAKFPFLLERTAAMLSFIVLEPASPKSEGEIPRKIREIQSVADLYVTTSDRDFVTELVENLAS